jgi:hypothetical protein
MPDILAGLLPEDLLNDPAPRAEATRVWLRELLSPRAERAGGRVQAPKPKTEIETTERD